jgi:O-antigen ligase
MTWLLGGYVWLYLHRPFEYWPWLGDLQIERAYVLFTLACWVAYPHKRWITNRLHAGIVAFTFVLLLCWVVSPYPNPGDKVWENHWHVLVFFVLMATTVYDEKNLRLLLRIYLAALFLYMGHSLFEYFNGRIEYRMKTTRMIGVDVTYSDPNTFAATLLHALPYVLPFWAETRRGSKMRWFLYAYVALTLLCILLTGSRRAFLGLGILAFMLIVLSRHRWALLALVALASPLVWEMMPSYLQNRYLTILDPSYGPANAETSAQFRSHAWVDGLRLFDQYPLTGVGPGAFGDAVGHQMQAHNLYAQTMAEMGLLGLASLALLSALFIWNGIEMRRLYRKNCWPADFPLRVSGATVLAVLLLLAMGLGGHNLYRYNWLWFGAFQIGALHCARTRAWRQPAALPARVFPQPPPPRIGYVYAG